MEDGNERAEFLKNTNAWNVEQAAEYLGVSTRTVASLVKSKKIPSYKLGKRRLFQPSDVIAWRASLVEATTLSQGIREQKGAA